MAPVPRPKARKPLLHPATILLQREWVWARLAVHWRLYRVGYHLHVRATWRRAHPDRRQQQRTILPLDLHLLLAQRVVRSEEDRMTTDDWQALEQIKEQMQQAAEERRAQGPEIDRASEREVSRAAARELERARQHESRLLASRTQAIGQAAEEALVRVLAGNDAPAWAFQQGQIAAMVDELTGPAASIEERLLAAVVAKARFEALLWSAGRDALLLDAAPDPHARAVRSMKPARAAGSPDLSARNQSGDQALLSKRVCQAEKRYLQALRELANLRRLDGPLPPESLIPAMRGRTPM